MTLSLCKSRASSLIEIVIPLVSTLVIDTISSSSIDEDNNSFPGVFRLIVICSDLKFLYSHNDVSFSKLTIPSGSSFT